VATSSSPLVLLDGHSLAFRAFFALPGDLQTTTGQLTNVVYGFTTMLVKLFGDFSPDRIAVCFDLGRPAYRHDVYEGYKANRRTTPDDFSSQMPLVREVLASLRIPVVEVAGYEADDLIATLVREAREEQLPVLVSVQADGEWVELMVRDGGPTPRLPRLPAEPPPALQTGGRGLWLILQLVDEVRLQRIGDGTRLTMRRRVNSKVTA
jgi:hypothetical protein